MSNSTVPLPTQLVLVSDARITNYLVAAAITLLIFDHILTIDQEIALVWKSPWNLTSSLFIWNRYYALIALTVNAGFMLREIESNKVCSVAFMFEGISASILVNTVDVILAIRVWILYEKNRKMLFFFIIFISAEFLTMLILAVITVSNLKTFNHLGRNLIGCWSTSDAPQLFTFYVIPTVVVSFVMFVMTIYRCGATLLWHNQRRIPIISLFLRDGVFWFLAGLIVLAPEILTTAVARGSRSLSELMIMPTLAVYSLIGSRALLNIKALVARSEVLGTMAGGTVGDRTIPFRAAHLTDLEEETLATEGEHISLHERQSP
ncbi:hypothetical protein BD779DRAFT_1537942 [Infundibulicybe gibba]|nr:hypothetical protein BD779DRAFT_1537942 [Infundibulicybe gibba]